MILYSDCVLNTTDSSEHNRYVATFNIVYLDIILSIFVVCKKK